MSLLLGALAPPPPDDHPPAIVSRPGVRRALPAAILTVAALAFVDQPPVVAAPEGWDVHVRPPAARRPGPRPEVAFVAPGAHAATTEGWAVQVRPPLARPQPNPTRTVYTDPTGTGDHHGWAVHVRTPAPRRPAPVVLGAFVDAPQAAPAPTPPAAGQMALPPGVGRTVVIPRTIQPPEAPVAQPAPEGWGVQVRPPLARRHHQRRPDILPPGLQPSAAPFTGPAVLVRPPAARRHLLVPPRAPIVPPILVAPAGLGADVLVRAPHRRKPTTPLTRTIFLDPTTGGPPPDFDLLCVHVVGTWPRVVEIALATPTVTPGEVWPRVVGTVLVTPLWDTPGEAWPRVVTVTLLGCPDD